MVPPPKRDTHAAGDRISQLPETVRHHILTFLETKDVVRIGVLSKKWHHTSASFPIPDFCQSMVGDDPFGVSTMEDRIRVFVEFVRKSLQSQSRIYGTIPEFYLAMSQHSPHTHIVRDCIQLAIQNKVKYLQIRFEQPEARLMMPEALLSAKELIMLNLYECPLSLPNIPTWPCLRKLCLQCCPVEGILLQNLTSSCPLLESLTLLYCELPDISLSGLTKLTYVDITRAGNDARDITVELDVPSLETLSLWGNGFFHVDLTACKNLTRLRLEHLPSITSRELTQLVAGLPALKSFGLRWGSDRIRFSSQTLVALEIQAGLVSETDLADLIAGLPALKFLSLECECDRIKFSSPRLEKLILSAQVMETELTDLIAGLPSLKYLSLVCKLKRIKFSSQQLEKLSLSVSELVEVSIDAPRLKTFTCSKMELSCDLFMGRSSPPEVFISSFSGSALSFLKLRKFLGGFKQINLLKLGLFGPITLLPPESMDVSIPLPDIRHLRIVTGVRCPTQSRGDCLALLTGLLWSCRPESISMNLLNNKLMTQVFFEELSKMVEGQHCCKDDDHLVESGFRGVRSFKIKQARGNAGASSISCDEFLELLPSLASEVEIHFMLEW